MDTASTQEAADQPGSSGRSANAPTALLNQANFWSPSTPPAAEWHTHWQSVVPELEELAR